MTRRPRKLPLRTPRLPKTSLIREPDEPSDNSSSAFKITYLPQSSTNTDENTSASVVTAIALGTTTDNNLHPVSHLIFAILVLVLIYAYLSLFFYALTFTNVLPQWMEFRQVHRRQCIWHVHQLQQQRQHPVHQAPVPACRSLSRPTAWLSGRPHVTRGLHVSCR